MKIVLVGYGKMGQTIERIAVSRGHEVVLRISSANKDELTSSRLQEADVAIEFTRPESARGNVLKCLSGGINVVSGTTGWNEGLQEAGNMAIADNRAFLHASNFSIGVNIFFEVNKVLARLMNGQEEYEVSIEETHHTAKKDAPSGTAITLAQQVLAEVARKKQWVLNDANGGEVLPIMAYRVEDVPGTHKVTYSSAIDDIELVHTAHSRDGFALGAVLAAEFLAGKTGVYSMKDVLGIS